MHLIHINSNLSRPFSLSLSLSVGFAVNLQVILANPRAQFKRRGSQPGMQESDFLKQITKVTDLEPKANNCTQVSSLFQSMNITALLDRDLPACAEIYCSSFCGR